MQFTIFDDPIPVVDKVCLRLVPSGSNGGVQLIAVDPHTGRKINSGIILEIGSNGTIDLIGGCEVPGIDKDSMARVQTRLR